MSELLPQTLEETIKMVQKELRQLIPADPQEKQEQEATQRLLVWLEDLHKLKTDDAAAIENAIDALRRIVDGIEMNPLVTSGDKHYKNRLNKLINNLEEVIELEAKKENSSGKDDKGTTRLPEKKADRNKSRVEDKGRRRGTSRRTV